MEVAAGAAVVTLCSAARLDHVRRQQRGLRNGAIARVIVWLDVDAPPSIDDVPEFEGAWLRHVPPGADGMRLAAGRNAGAVAAIGAGASLLVFLDADCIAGPDLLPAYSAAAALHPGAVLCGPVTYLPEGVLPADDAALVEATAPHAARPAPPLGVNVVARADEYPLFWSLSFALSATTWTGLGGFDEAYEGYGGEDTDFAFTARSGGVPLVWVGGAHAYHQYHPTSSPPRQHLGDILRNGSLFASKWGSWPMEGWLAAFEREGLVRREGSGWVRLRPPLSVRRWGALLEPSRCAPSSLTRRPWGPEVE